MAEDDGSACPEVLHELREHGCADGRISPEGHLRRRCGIPPGCR
ncbi:hypothetical protein ABZ370_31320 [Streptomyces sp. NPDC005962]